jgi:hypothetical protein
MKVAVFWDFFIPSGQALRSGGKFTGRVGVKYLVFWDFLHAVKNLLTGSDA